jgi:hypothetical protein
LATCLKNKALDECAKYPATQPLLDHHGQKQQEDPNETPTERGAELAPQLQQSLLRLSQQPCFALPERANAVDYFVVLVLTVRIRLAVHLYKGYRQRHWENGIGQETVRVLREWLVLPYEWQMRKLSSWAPTLGEICAALDDHWSATDERPTMMHIVAILSQFAVAPGINTEHELMRWRWATWVSRARRCYCQCRNVLDDPAKLILDYLIGQDSDDELQ